MTIHVDLTGRRLQARGRMRVDSQKQKSKAGKVTGLCRADCWGRGEKRGMILIIECLYDLGAFIYTKHQVSATMYSFCLTDEASKIDSSNLYDSRNSKRGSRTT